ncbi:MAG: DUF2652 domain-containing protein [Flavobacteriales bacterium]|nr:DUF2652 domain-containing protein [Flavobacteriales bacterium]
MIKKGYFIITDISGYTSYLSTSELDHAHEILKSLFDAQISHIKDPFIISNFQGDAILSYVPEEAILQKQTLIELVEDVYYSFTQKKELMQFNTTCTCNACKNLSGLDLKVFVHFGDYMVQELGGREELVGSDVIIAHRMMKNQVIEQTGINAYALFSEKAALALELDNYCHPLKNYRDNYEHVGEVNMFVHCLKTQWEKEREKNRNCVTKEEAWVGVDFEVEAPPAFVWEFITDIDLKIQWAGFPFGERTDDLGGRIGVGSSFHCAHGELDFRYQVIDWKPFEYYTSRETGMNGLVYDTTYSLKATENGTLFGNYVRYPIEGPIEETKEMMQGAWDQVFIGIKEMVEKAYQAQK